MSATPAQKTRNLINHLVDHMLAEEIEALVALLHKAKARANVAAGMGLLFDKEEHDEVQTQIAMLDAAIDECGIIIKSLRT